MWPKQFSQSPIDTKYLKRQILILLCPATGYSPPGALFETRGITSDTVNDVTADSQMPAGSKKQLATDPRRQTQTTETCEVLICLRMSDISLSYAMIDVLH